MPLFPSLFSPFAQKLSFISTFVLLSTSTKQLKMSLLTIESIKNSSGRSEELVFLFGSIPGSSHTVGNQFDLEASVISPVGRRSVFC